MREQDRHWLFQLLLKCECMSGWNGEFCGSNTFHRQLIAANMQCVQVYGRGSQFIALFLFGNLVVQQLVDVGWMEVEHSVEFQYWLVVDLMVEQVMVQVVVVGWFVWVALFDFDVVAGVGSLYFPRLWPDVPLRLWLTHQYHQFDSLLVGQTYF